MAMKYRVTRRVYLITIEGKKDEDPYAFIGDSHKEFLEYYKWFGHNNRVAMSKLSFVSMPVAEQIKG